MAASFITKIFRLVTKDEQTGAVTVAQPVRFVDADGNDVSLGGDAPTTIPTGALIPGSGIDLDRDDSGVLTCSVKAKGVTAAMLADGVAVSGPKGADGKSVKALALTVDADGKVTGGTMTLSDNSTVAVTVTTATA